MVKKTGMESLRELYKIGRGPSSSHTIGPEKAAKAFADAHPEADGFQAVLFGSLARTGKGHGTDAVLKKTFLPRPCDVRFDTATTSLPHPNTLDLYALKAEKIVAKARVMSVGGGNIRWQGEEAAVAETVYRLTTYREIAAVCAEKGRRLWQYAATVEGDDLFCHLERVWQVMGDAIDRGLAAEGPLPGGLAVERKAKRLFEAKTDEPHGEESRRVAAYAFAVGEENAAGGEVVTAPTCGAAGVLPAVLRYAEETLACGEEQILRGLATAGIVGNLIKTNASISGAECGCQAEIGSACAMAAAALAEIGGYSLDVIECAAEIALEHHLGLTCDPIGGLVQIPCIERNAVAALRAIEARRLADLVSAERKISLDRVIAVMNETGRDLKSDYRETAAGGLAKSYPYSCD